MAREVNFDSISGPTYNYSALSPGNLASTESGRAGRASNPRAAALAGLAKMRLLQSLGVPQGVLPPQERPRLDVLRALGFSGSDACVVQRAAKEAPTLLAQVSSGSSVWAANAATVAPSADSGDGRVHFTPANLATTLHRSLEPEATYAVLARIFASPRCFVVHRPLPAHAQYADEGAANHMRLASSHGAPGAHVFVYGRDAEGPGASPAGVPSKFPARQTREACRAIARLHGLAPERVVLLRQNPEVVDAGVFHNDVIATSNEALLLYHERAYVDPGPAIERLRAIVGGALETVRVEDAELSVAEAVSTYLFNSQIVTLPSGETLVVAPSECEEHPRARAALDRLSAARPRTRVRYVDLRDSMANGGGPACLRLRVVLTDEELAAVHPGALLTDALYERLCAWVSAHYRDRLTGGDLSDPSLLYESQRALDELTAILGLGSIYALQRA